MALNQFFLSGWCNRLDRFYVRLQKGFKEKRPPGKAKFGFSLICNGFKCYAKFTYLTVLLKTQSMISGWWGFGNSVLMEY